MPRPTFTASEIARYVYCNVAWAIEERGEALDPTVVAVELKRLEERGENRTREEEQELRFLHQVRNTFAKRAAGEVYHAKVHDTATTLVDRTRRLFVKVFIAVLVVAAIVAVIMMLSRA